MRWPSRCRYRMRRLQAVIAYCAAGRETDVHERGPAFEFVVTVAMKKIGRGDGDSGGCGFNHGEGRVIVHDIVGQENLLPAAPAHVQSRKIVERARRPDARKQPAILFVPETVCSREIFSRGFADFRPALGDARGLLLHRFLRSGRLYYHARRKQQQQEFKVLPFHGSLPCGCAFLLYYRVVAPFSRYPGSRFCCYFRYVFPPGIVIPIPRRYFENWPLKCCPRSSSCPAPYYFVPPLPSFWLAHPFPRLSLSRRILNPSRRPLAAPAKRKKTPPNPRRSSPTTRWT